MDVDPLQDYPAPRYAVESDDSEDESFRPGGVQGSSATVTVQLPRPSHLPVPISLVVLIGSAGQQWLQHVSPTPTLQTINCCSTEIGAIDFSTYKGATLVTVTHDLPSLYAAALAEELLTMKFTAIYIVDTYAGPSYISSTPFDALRLPVRYLQTTAAARSKSLQRPPSQLLPFSPPNLVQGLAASLLSQLEMSPTSPSVPGRLVLLPSNRIPPPPPRKEPRLTPLSLQEKWSVDMLELVAETLGTILPWSLEHETKGFAPRARQTSASDEGMYI